MKRKLLPLVALVGAVFLGSPAHGRDRTYRIEKVDRTVDSTLGLVRYQYVVQEGDNALNQFTMHRVVKAGRDGHPVSARWLEGAIVLLPGEACNFEMFEYGSNPDSLVNHLAQRGVDVYGYSYRTRSLAYGDCGTRDCSAMAEWNIATHVRDIGFITRFATMIHWRRPVVGGMSLGAIMTIAAVNARPNAYAGAIVWEGALYYADPSLQQSFAESCATYRAALAGGVLFDDQTFPFIQQAGLLYLSDPSGTSPFAEGLTNRDFMILFAATPNDPPVGSVPGYTYATGDFENGFAYVDDGLFYQFAVQLNAYNPLAMVADYACAFAGDRTYTNNLSAFNGPLLAMEAEHGFGTYMEDNLGLFAGAEITRLFYENRSHADLMVPTDYVASISEPIYEWVSKVLSKRP